MAIVKTKDGEARRNELRGAHGTGDGSRAGKPGTTPFDTRELLKAGLAEVRRVIRDQEPLRPSARLSTMIAADLTSLSLHRQAEPPKLIREVRGDLDCRRGHAPHSY